MVRTCRTALAVVATLLVASCGGGDDDGADGGAPDGTDPAATADGGSAAPGDAEMADADVDRDATMRYGYYIALATFDPHKSNGSNDNTWLFPVYDRLVHTTPSAEPEPGLAESWEFAEDGSYLEMSLREGVTFHDGEPFDAEAVKANIERAQTVEGSTMVTVIEHITEVEVMDELTVRLHTSRPDASLPLTLSDRAGAMISPAAFENADLATNPVGAGSYRVTEYLPEDRAVYERYEEYWDVENTQLAGIEISVQIDTNTRLNALRSGQLDAAEIDPNQVAEAEAAGLNTEVGPDVSFSLLQFNSENRPEFADERVRRAVNHAIDRNAIVEGLVFGYGTPAVQPFPDEYFANNPDVGTDVYEFDPDLARELLAEAGYEDGFAFEIITTNTPLRVQVTEAIQQQLADVGLEVTIRQIQGAGPFLDIVYSEQQGDAWMLAWGGRPDPSGTADALYGGDSFNNPSGLTTDGVEALLEESVSVFDDDERAAVLQELSAAIVEANLDVVVLYFPEKIVAYNDRVLGAEIWTVGRPEFRGMAMTAG